MNDIFADVDQAVEEIRAGGILIVVDDEDRENEGDFVMAAELVTPEAVNLMVTRGRGLVCQAVTEARARELRLPPMAPENTSAHSTAFTVSVDLREVTSTGISAFDRAATIRAVADPRTRPEDLLRPGHIFPLTARDGGVLARRGHTEAAVELPRLAGLRPSGVLCEILDRDGSMARLPRLAEIARELGMKILTVESLVRRMEENGKKDPAPPTQTVTDAPVPPDGNGEIAGPSPAWGGASGYGSAGILRTGPQAEPGPGTASPAPAPGAALHSGGPAEPPREPAVPPRRLAESILPTEEGLFRVILYENPDSPGQPHLALVSDRGFDPEEALVRIHSECLTGEVLGSRKCDCGSQLRQGMRRIAREGGVLVYLRQEGRGIGLAEKIRAYALQDRGLDTVEANIRLGHEPDERDFSIASTILADLGIRGVRLLTNNPDKIASLREGGIRVKGRLPLEMEPTPENRAYLTAKKRLMRHLLEQV